MKSSLLALAVLLTIVLCPSSAWSQPPIKYFGYSEAVTDADLNRVSPYTNFSYIPASYNTSLVSQLKALKGKGMRAVIDLGGVLWCADNPSNPLFSQYHLCTDADPGGLNYVERWDAWVYAHRNLSDPTGTYLNTNYVIAFSVITEHTLRGISVSDVQTATALVDRDFADVGIDIKTLIFENADHIADAGASYQVPNNVDWIGSFKYSVEPDLDEKFEQSIDVLKAGKQSWQKMIYILDGIYGTGHWRVAPTYHDMDAIAQQWYHVASRDTEAVLLGVFTWPNVPSENLIGSANMGTTVLNKHTAIGKAILAGKSSIYQGKHEIADCRRIDGWAWDTSQPNTPISVDIYVDGVVVGAKRATVRANQYRAGIGNGYHGFSSLLPAASLQDGKTHVITVTYNGTLTPLNSSSKTIRCSNPSASVAWVKPAEVTWGPANTMTVAGYAQGGFGGVQMHWRDDSENGNWRVAAWEPTPSQTDNSWSNTIPSSNRCHDYSVYVTYAGITSQTYTYEGLKAGYCTEQVSIIWVQPQPRAGFGAPGSLVLAGSAKNAPPGYGVKVKYRNLTTGGGWVQHPYAPAPDPNGIWLVDIPVNSNYSHVYEFQASYDVVTSLPCTYPGNNSIKWCQ